GVAVCVRPRRGMVDRHPQFRWPRQNILIHCQLGVDVEVAEAESRWSVSRRPARPTGIVANYDLAYPPSISPPMIDASFTLRFLSLPSRDVIRSKYAHQHLQ